VNIALETLKRQTGRCVATFPVLGYAALKITIAVMVPWEIIARRVK